MASANLKYVSLQRFMKAKTKQTLIFSTMKPITMLMSNHGTPEPTLSHSSLAAAKADSSHFARSGGPQRYWFR
ncbi:hypothetical protein AMTR_s00009p00258890 [Amborella trichopoda]|uniref:Uncharacterized protein n=1 Tax=Amborella trichopoda TaxID=13333 RepID=W1NH45_AMBTC|nr:hypothetical protein AMTR_s00009p00258890 [Amborella trichopoda]